MPKFIKKPITVEAEQYILCSGFLPTGVQLTTDGIPYVMTKQGQPVRVSSGEWIVKEPDGSGYYPVAAELFYQLFEPVPEPPTFVVPTGDERAPAKCLGMSVADAVRKMKLDVGTVLRLEVPNGEPRLVRYWGCGGWPDRAAVKTADGVVDVDVSRLSWNQ